MATQVRFEDVFSCDGSLWFRFGDGEAFSVKSLNNGVMVIAPICGCTIHSFAKNVAGCFEEGSNFNGLKAIEFEFNGAYVSVTAKNVLSQVWKHGEALRKWHNKEYDYEGDGVVNPAVLTVGVG